MSDGPGRWGWVFDFVTMVAVLIGLTFGAFELRQLRDAQESQVVLELFQTMQSPEYVRGAGLILALPDSLSPDDLREIMRTEEGQLIQPVRLTLEGLGLMVYRHDVSLEWVDELFRLITVTTWEKFEALVMDDRERMQYPAQMEWHQWLYERLLERASDGDPTPAYEAFRDWEER